MRTLYCVPYLLNVLFRGQMNLARPTQAPVKFTGAPANQRANSALYNTKTRTTIVVSKLIHLVDMQHSVILSAAIDLIAPFFFA